MVNMFTFLPVLIINSGMMSVCMFHCLHVLHVHSVFPQIWFYHCTYWSTICSVVSEGQEYLTARYVMRKSGNFYEMLRCEKSTIENFVTCHRLLTLSLFICYIHTFLFLFVHVFKSTWGMCSHLVIRFSCTITLICYDTI